MKDNEYSALDRRVMNDIASTRPRYEKSVPTASGYMLVIMIVCAVVYVVSQIGEL